MHTLPYEQSTNWCPVSICKLLMKNSNLEVCMCVQKGNLMSPQNTLQISIFPGSVPPDPPRTILGPLLYLPWASLILSAALPTRYSLFSISCRFFHLGHHSKTHWSFTLGYVNIQMSAVLKCLRDVIVLRALNSWWVNHFLYTVKLSSQFWYANFKCNIYSSRSTTS